MVYLLKNSLKTKGPRDILQCGYPGVQGGHTTHLRARLGLSGRMAVKSLQESDLCDRHPSRVLMPLFLQQIRRQKEGGCRDHNCQVYKRHLDPPPSPPQVAPEESINWTSGQGCVHTLCHYSHSNNRCGALPLPFP